MDQDQNQEQQHTPLGDLANNQKNKILSSLGKRAGAAAGRAAIAGLGAIGWPVIIGIVAILFFTILIVVITGGPSNAATPPSPSPTTSQNINGLFNITGATIDQQNAIYGFFQETATYPTYQKLLTGAVSVNVSFGFDPGLSKGWCGGSVSNGDITFYNYSSCGVGGQRYLFFHESGHTIGNKNPDLYNLYASSYSGLVAQDGPQCYSDGFLNSYVKEFGGIAGPINESFAESVAVSLLKSWGSFNDFPNNCPATYNWISKYVLGL